MKIRCEYKKLVPVGELQEHPTMKPVELVAYLMGNSSKPGQIVLDTFGGSGTTAGVYCAQGMG